MRVLVMGGKNDSKFMLECEAREWLRRGFNNRHDIRTLQNAISKRRGFEASEQLIEEMRKQWKNRAEWLN